MELLYFLSKVFIISFSGAMQPGPVTATVITMGSRNRYAGALLALGHAIIELPLMILIMLGMEKLLKSEKTQIAIGLAGGAFLLVMATQMMLNLRTPADAKAKPVRDRPLMAGIILSASNPYFLLWWATIGLRLALDLKTFEIWAFALFALVHWSTDFAWLQALSFASFKGSRVFALGTQRTILFLCALALFGFGLFFICTASAALAGLRQAAG